MNTDIPGFAEPVIEPSTKNWAKDWLVSGIRDSSVVWSLHFSTPTSLFKGNDFSGFFRPINDSAVNSFLSTLGWVYGKGFRFYIYGKAGTFVFAAPTYLITFYGMYTLISNHVLTFFFAKNTLNGSLNWWWQKYDLMFRKRKCKLKQTTFRFYWWMVQVRIRCTSKGDRTYNKCLPVTGPLSYPRCWWAVWFGRSYRPRPAE